jgi:hypothetical protein
MRLPLPPQTTRPPLPARRYPLTTLCLLTLVVLGIHWALLSDAVLSLASHAAQNAAPAQAFTTRMVAAPALPALPVPPPRKPPKPPVPTTPPPAMAEPSPAIAPDATGDAVQASAVETDTAVALDTSDPAPAPAAQMPENAASAAPTEPPAPPQPTSAPPAHVVTEFQFPAPVLLKYDVRGKQRGFPYAVNGELQWSHDGETYRARLAISHFLLGSRVQTSTGALTAQGLEPVRFGDKFRSEVAAHFERGKGKVSFSANSPEVPLQPGSQDQLSVFLQLASMLAGAPNAYPAGTTLPFQAVGPRSASNWTFTVGAIEKLTLPGGEISALRLWREPTEQYEPKGEIWLAPAMGYLPVRIRLSKSEDEFSDMQWSETAKP